jgi:hypothetical protein
VRTNDSTNISHPALTTHASKPPQPTEPLGEAREAAAEVPRCRTYTDRPESRLSGFTAFSTRGGLPVEYCQGFA